MDKAVLLDLLAQLSPHRAAYRLLTRLLGRLLLGPMGPHPARLLGSALQLVPATGLGNGCRRAIFRAALAGLALRSTDEALHAGDRCIHLAPGADTALLLARLWERSGAIRRPLEVLAPYEDAHPGPVRRLREQLAHLREGMPEASSDPPEPLTLPEPRRSLYYVAQSLPHHSSGYAIRTHYLLRSLAEEGWTTKCYARYGYPNDRWDFRSRGLVEPHAQVDGVTYCFRPRPHSAPELSPEQYQQAAVDALVDQARAFRPSLIHCASNHVVGLAGTEAARRLGLPSVYEVRGLWHLTRSFRQPAYEGSEHFRMTSSLELQAARRADRVLAITAGVRDLLVAGGVEQGKISLLPNAVDSDLFCPRPPDSALAAALGLRDEVIIGFVGSFAPYEGLQSLLRAVSLLRERVQVPFRLLLVGDGQAMPLLRRRARELEISDLVLFPGRVPHRDVLRYYSLVHIAAYPRAGHQVCELVSPLKPLEAMAMAKAVILSDVGGQADMAEHGRTALFCRKDDLESLAAGLAELVTAPALREQLGRQARRWVRKERSWSNNAETVTRVYCDILAP